MKLARTTAANNLLGKAVWKATLTASETDRQNHHRLRPHGSLLLFSSLITRHYFLPLSNLLNGVLKHRPRKSKFLANIKLARKKYQQVIIA